MPIYTGMMPDMDAAIWTNLAPRNIVPERGANGHDNEMKDRDFMSCAIHLRPGKEVPLGTMAMLLVPMKKGLEASMRLIKDGVRVGTCKEEPETQRDDATAAPAAAQPAPVTAQSTPVAAQPPAEAWEIFERYAPTGTVSDQVKLDFHFPHWNDAQFDLGMNVDDFLAGQCPDPSSVPENPPPESSPAAKSRISTPSPLPRQ